MRFSPSRLFLFAGSVFCVLPIMNPARALLLGIAGVLIFQKDVDLRRPINLLLKASIVLLGFGLDWSNAVASSSTGLRLTALTVVSTLILGVAIGKMLGIDKKITLLIAVGTAICGGSAIAAISPIINAKSEQLSFSLVIIFILNGIALLIFPVIGRGLHLGQEVFGTWAAISIHDTSSVIGAAGLYGDQSLEVGTTTKLTRALWIIPMVILFGLFEMKEGLKKIKVPWFILLFILAMITAHYLPQWGSFFEIVNLTGKKGMVLVLFFVGMSFDFTQAKKAGAKYFAFGVLLWLIVSVSSLLILTTAQN